MEKGVSVRVARLTDSVHGSVAATDNWGGAGLEKDVTSAAAIFAGIGYDLTERKISPRFGVTIGI